MKTELETYKVDDGKIHWPEIVRRLDMRVYVILPVEIDDIETNFGPGKFHVSVCIENGKQYIQFENFSSPEFGQDVLNSVNVDWITEPGGIFRFEF